MFQDIRQPRRSLKEVLPGHSVPISRPKKVKPEVSVDPEEKLKVTTYFPDPPRSSRSGLFISLLILVVAIVGFVAWSSLFSWAKVVVVPKTAELVFDKIVINYAPVESMIFTPVSESATLIATGQEKISEKATGEVVIYNDFSSTPQKLIATTRLESKTGKIYRLIDAVTVPGQKTVAGKLTPGSVEAKIIADAPGESYNSSVTDLTIPGFKGGPRYDKFLARSLTPIVGGFVGTRPVVAVADKTKAVESLHTSLIQKLMLQSRNQIPEGFILYNNAANFEFKDEIATGTGTSSKAVLTSTVSGNAYLLEEERLTAKLLESQPKSEVSGLVVKLPDIRSLEVKIMAGNQATTTKDRVLKLTIAGKTKAIAQVKVDELATILADKPKSEATGIFNQIREIQNARVNFMPSWLRRFPQDPAKIKIQLESATQTDLTP